MRKFDIPCKYAVIFYTLTDTFNAKTLPTAKPYATEHMDVQQPVAQT
jgi:hypothetical protein